MDQTLLFRILQDQASHANRVGRSQWLIRGLLLCGSGRDKSLRLWSVGQEMTAVAASSIADTEGHLALALSFFCLCLDCAVPDPETRTRTFYHDSGQSRLPPPGVCCVPVCRGLSGLCEKLELSWRWLAVWRLAVGGWFL